MIKILIVDDKPQIQLLYNNILSLLDYNVIGIASDGERAFFFVG